MTLRAASGAIALCLALSGCPAPGTRSLDGPRGDGAIRPPPQGCTGGVVSKDVTFPSADGLVVHGTSVNPCGGSARPLVVLSHQLCSDRSEWSAPSHDWVSAFSQRGVASLAIDLRGHGQSKVFPDGSTKDLCAGGSDADYAGMVGDVKAAAGYARDMLKARGVAVIGASIGSNSSIVAFADDAQLAMVVALSPGLDYRSIKTDGAIGKIGSRPALLEAAKDDPDSANSVVQLGKINGAVMTMIWETGGHANSILAAHPEELTRVADLVTSTLGP